MKRRTAKTSGQYIRVSVSIPKELWPYFERQRKKPKHAGNRSSYVRSLVLEQIEDERESSRIQALAKK